MLMVYLRGFIILVMKTAPSQTMVDSHMGKWGLLCCCSFVGPSTLWATGGHRNSRMGGIGVGMEEIPHSSNCDQAFKWDLGERRSFFPWVLYSFLSPSV